MESGSLRIVDIIDGTTVDGPGFRTSIYFAGCDHRCIGCHNPLTWAHDAGQEMTVEELLARIDANDMDVTFSGGDPLYQIEQLIPLALAVKERGRTLWCYTGFTFEEIVVDRSLRRITDYADVIVDGPFILSLRDIGLLFRGSSNQRLIDVDYWRRTGQIAQWHSSF